MQVSQIQQQYCQTSWGRVCYWFTFNKSQLQIDPSNVKLVLFLHGVGGSGRYWFSYLEELVQNKTSVIGLAPDLLGFGASDKPAIEYTKEVHLAVIETVLQNCLHNQDLAEVGQVELELVGHSMGGILGLLLAGRVVSNETDLKSNLLNLTRLTLLGTPYASPAHDLEQEVLRSPLNRAMLSRPLVCESVHHTLKLLWPLVLFLIRKGWVNPRLPFPVVADYMEHTCRSYTSSAHHVIFETNLDPVLQLLQVKSTKLLQTLLIYSRNDEEVPWLHGQELATWFKFNYLEILEQINHQALGEAALPKILPFLFSVDKEAG